MAWARKTAICPPSWSCSSGLCDQPIPTALLSQRLLARPASGQLHSRPRAIRSCISPIRRARPGSPQPNMVDGINELNRLRQRPGRRSRNRGPHHSFELAFRMQTSVPELMSIQANQRTLLERYGPDVAQPGQLRPQLPAGPPAGRARRPFRAILPSRLGPARRRHRRIAPQGRPPSINPSRP